VAYAAAPVIKKYTGVLAAADGYTASTTFVILESVRRDLGVGSQVHAVLITQRSRVQIPPPPPSKRWLARLVHRARAPDQRFRVRTSVWNCRFSGLFIGTCSTVPYAALRRVAQRVRPVRCAFAVESSVEIAVHRAGQGMPYACDMRSHVRSESAEWRLADAGDVTSG